MKCRRVLVGLSLHVALQSSGIEAVWAMEVGSGSGSMSYVYATPPRNRFTDELCESLSDGRKVCKYPSLVSGFLPGDVIYGVEEARAPTRALFEQRGMEPLLAITVDRLNDWVFEFLREESGELMEDADSVGRVIESLISRGQMSVLDGSRLKEYQQFLLAEIRAGQISSPRGSASIMDVIPVRERFVGEACVAAVRFIRHQGKKIHFILDAMDQAAAFSKMKDTYTSQEIRSVLAEYLDSGVGLSGVKDRSASWIEFYFRGHRLDEESKLRWLDSLQDQWGGFLLMGLQ